MSLKGPPHNQPVAEVSRHAGVSVPTLYDWDWRRQRHEQDQTMPADGSNPGNQLSQDKLAVAVETPPMNDTDCAGWPTRAAICSIQTEFLPHPIHQHNAQHHRGRARARTPKVPPRHVADAPNRIWCWDVTYQPSRGRGLFFYLFAIIDLYSRKLIALGGASVRERRAGCRPDRAGALA